MSPLTQSRRGGPPSLLSGAPLVMAVVAFAVVIAGVLWGFGLIDLSRRPQEPSTAGLVAVPTPSRKIPAYTRLTRDHIWDVRNARMSVVYLPPKAVTPEMIQRIADVIGRVLDHDKLPGYVFTESDFLPRGTREGMVAGIPAGRRAIRISADRVEGLFGLHPGDRFDLLATMAIDGQGGSSFNFGGAYGQQLALQARLTNWQKQATVRVMVQNGIIVEPMNTRGVPTYQSSLTDGGSTQMRPVQEAVIAINPDEVARLTEAMAVQAHITAIPRSGRPDDPVESRTPDLYPSSPFTRPGAGPFTSVETDGEGKNAFKVVETIMGQKRELTAVPKP